MRTKNDLTSKNSSTREYSISIVENEKEIFVFEYSANELFAEHWNTVFAKLMEANVTDFDLGKLMFNLSVVDYDASIDLPENGLMKFKILCQFAQMIDRAIRCKAADVKKK